MKLQSKLMPTTVLLFSLLFAGCGITFTFIKPTPSTVKYSAIEKADIVLGIIDNRKDADTSFHGGRFRDKVELEIEDSDEVFDEINMFASSIKEELNARGVKTECVVGKEADYTLYIKRMQIVNMRFTGFDPWQTFHVFVGELKTPDGSKRIPFYFYNGEMPVWSMNEVSMPCYSMPFSIMVKQIASKINLATLGNKVDDNYTEKLINDLNSAKIDDDMEDEEKPTWKIFELGATNNEKAIPVLKKWADHEDRFLRACALSCLGLYAQYDDGSMFGFLKERFEKYEEVDMMMAMKSIGDLNTDEAKAFLKGIGEDKEKMDDLGIMNFYDNVYNVQ